MVIVLGLKLIISVKSLADDNQLGVIDAIRGMFTLDS